MNLEVFLSPLICLFPLHWTTISNLLAIGIRTTISNVFYNETFELWTKIPNQFCNLHWTTHLQSLFQIRWTQFPASSAIVMNCNFLSLLQLHWTTNCRHIFEDLFLSSNYCIEPWLICTTITTTVYVFSGYQRHQIQGLTVECRWNILCLVLSSALLLMSSS
jgi:hypothetical protein